MKLNKFANTMMIMLIIFMCEKNVSAQHNIPVFGNQNLLNGYTKDITGEVWPYYSSSPIFAKEALLTRCTDGKKTISWETENAPAKLDKDYYYFYWLSGHSSGTSVAVSTFSLSINGTNYLSFKIPLNEKPPLVWNVSGKDSVAVVFSATKTDVCKDLFGGMYLRVPRKLLTPGKPLYLSITGNAEKRNDWFMVFKYNYSEKVLVRPTPFLVYTDKGIKQQIQLSVDHIFPEIKHLTVIINNNTMDFPVTEGSNDVLLPLDTVVKPTQLHIIVKNGSTVIKEFDVLQSPVQHKEVDIIAHSHNDIGYSHVQEEVMKVQQKNIMDALDMIDRTKNFPDGSRFVWNEETLWPVEYFLNHANEYNKERFIRAVKNNSIALSAFYVGVMTGLCSAEEIRWICEYAVYLKSKYGFNINTAMLSDIPGISWSTVDALNNSGVSYLSNGPNDGERLGTLYQYLGDKPCYWKSTDGKGKVLLWTAGLGYSAFHSVPFEELGNKMKEKLTNYLGVLDSSHYPYDMVQLRYTIKSDNGPLDTNLSNFVRDWNAKYASPKLNIANVGDMMSRFEKKYGNTLPVLSGDFTPYWEDGAYSTAAEEGENRILSDRVAQLEKFATTHPERLLHNNWFYEARKNVVMFHEHTWGAWNSTSEPDAPFVINQWNYKKAFLDSTKLYLNKIEQVLIPENKTAQSLTVYNSLPRVRSGYVEVDLPDNVQGNGVMDESGEFSFIQYLNNKKVCFLAKNVPAMGSKKYSFVSSKRKMDIPADEYSYSIDSISGALKQLGFMNKEWVSTKEFRGLNQALYVKGFDPAGYTTSKVKQIEPAENAFFTKTIRINSDIEGAKGISYLISFYHGLDYIKLTCIVDKNAIRTKEGMHIVFPFNITQPIDRIGISDTFFIPGSGQMMGSNYDFYSVQQWLDVSNAENGATLSSPQAALFELGSMTDERPLTNGRRGWKTKPDMSANVFLYALNNYWNTNFKADQEGKITFDCYIRLHKKFDLKEAKQFGEEIHAPLIPVWE